MIPISIDPIEEGIFFKDGQIIDKFFYKSEVKIAAPVRKVI